MALPPGSDRASVSPSAVIQCSTAWPSDRCVWRTALGRPVVPELNTKHRIGVGVVDDGTGSRRPGRRVVEREDRDGRQRVGQRRASGLVADRETRADDRPGVLDLRRLPRRAEHHDRRAELQRAVHHEHELRPVRGHQGDASTADRACRSQRHRPLVGAGLHLAEREASILEVERDAVPIAGRPAPEYVGERPRCWQWRSIRSGSDPS